MDAITLLVICIFVLYKTVRFIEFILFAYGQSWLNNNTARFKIKVTIYEDRRSHLLKVITISSLECTDFLFSVVYC
uniref:Putative secreted protein n=1 Tax=Xenopsylla cheopis TaxID=163159 RepID=A0A6M2DY34_XENCH